MEERRRSPRHIVDGQTMAVHSAESVRVLDLSASGVLLQLCDAVNVRSKAMLRLSVAGSPFAAEIEIMRVAQTAGADDGFRIAAQFLEITPKHRQLIERFISQ
jgi:c-di-GMP-binding flagellar brake protein YcgR